MFHIGLSRSDSPDVTGTFPKNLSHTCGQIPVESPIALLQNTLLLLSLCTLVITVANKSTARIQAVNAAQDWLQNNVAPVVEPAGSLATEMTRRALEAEQVRPAASPPRAR